MEQPPNDCLTEQQFAATTDTTSDEVNVILEEVQRNSEKRIAKARIEHPDLSKKIDRGEELTPEEFARFSNVKVVARKLL